MSWRASAWAKTQTAGSPGRKAVLLCLAEATDQWGYTWSGELTIGEEAELSDRQVRRIVKELANGGLITIFQAPGRSNLYRLNFQARPKDKIPKDHPSLSGRYEHHVGPEISPNPGQDVRRDPGQNVRPAPDKSCHNPGHLEPEPRTPVSAEPIGTDKNRETRAREADRPKGSASHETEQVENSDAQTPINAHWNARQADLAKALSLRDLHWLMDAIPHEDDGATLVLAVPSRWFGEQIDARVGHERLQRIVERTIKFLPKEYAAARRHERLNKPGANT
jgi:hypothetical protein